MMLARGLSHQVGAAASSQRPSAPPRAPQATSAVHSQRAASSLRSATASTRSAPLASGTWAPAAFSTGRAGRRTAGRVRANWGAPVEFQPARIVSNSPAAEGPLHKLVIDVGALANGYTVPGQFVQIKVADSKPGFFAIASAPGAHAAGQLEFLIKGAPGTTAELLCAVSAGSEVMVSPVMGRGFPLDRLPPATTNSVLMFATGSGISPIRAILESGAMQGRDVTLYYGTRNPEATAYRELLPGWEAAGVKVVQVYSESKQGYVHDVFEREGLSRLPADAAASVGAVLCGHKGMCQAVTALLAAKGVPPERILLNF